MSWRDVPFPISHLTPVAGRLPLKREISTHWQAGCFFSNVWLYYIYVWQGSRWCRGTRVGEQMLVSGNSNVGVGEQQCWCRGTCMLVSADEHSCQATSTLRTFCTSRTLCTLRTVYALFARLERRRTGLAEECQAKAKAKTILARSNGVCVKARAKNIYLFTTYSISKPYGLCSRSWAGLCRSAPTAQPAPGFAMPGLMSRRLPWRFAGLKQRSHTLCMFI